MEPQVAALGAFHSGRSKAAASALITSAVSTVIQNDSVNVGT